MFCFVVFFFLIKIHTDLNAIKNVKASQDPLKKTMYVWDTLRTASWLVSDKLNPFHLLTLSHRLPGFQDSFHFHPFLHRPHFPNTSCSSPRSFLSSYTKDRKCKCRWRTEFAVTPLGQHRYHKRLPLGFPHYSGLQLTHSVQSFSEVYGVCACTASDHFSLLNFAEEFLQQHLGCFRESRAKGWLGAVHRAGWKAGTESQRQALCVTWLAEEQNNWGIIRLLQCKVILLR